ncbi:hypothetical protein [Micromonospora carbonacea]|uniref:Uncharacterized protein n=1 Tax=Micromonospora carbonacea TaxID=47853 RepID=A0A7H8XHJ3_9ACTN|nr:hypothetical protein [Micromonospora carbonacea]MBB5828554.1 hypothetical protein [Micromonospora carbonacea]QLD23849.1 hypothetical protein HXZ27_06200 [Micromonospora carbonacea]
MDSDPVARAWSGVEIAIVHPTTRKTRRIGYRRRAVEKPVGPRGSPPAVSIEPLEGLTHGSAAASVSAE